MLRMHTRTLEVVEGSLIAMIDGCVHGSASVNMVSMVGFIWFLHIQLPSHMQVCRPRLTPKQGAGMDTKA